MGKVKKIALLLANGIGYYVMWPAIAMNLYYYDAMQEAFQMTAGQMGVFGTAYGLTAVIAFILGGILSDKFKPKVLLLLSYVFNIAAYMFYATIPDFSVLIIVEPVIVLVVIGLFWGSYSKYVRSLAGPENENRMTGIQFAFAGISGAVLGLLVSGWIAQNGAESGLRFMCYLNAAFMAVVIVVDLFLWKPEKESTDATESEDDKFQMKYVSAVLKMPEFWLGSLAIFAIYASSVVTSYMAPLMAVLGVPLAIVSFIGTFRYFLVRLVMAPVGGVAMDKIGSPLRVVRAMLVVAAISIVFAIYCVLGADVPIFIPALVVVVLAIAYNVSVPAWYTTVTEVRVPSKMRGTAIGILAGIFMSPDAFMYAIAGGLLESYGETTGYTILFAIVLAMVLGGIVCATIAHKIANKKAKAESVA